MGERRAKDAAIQVDIIVGLGNPGARYQHTRHNVGFAVVDLLAQHHGIVMRCHDVTALCGAGRIGPHPLLLVKPQTYMNASGRVVAPLVHRHLQSGERLIVAHDDIDLPLGTMRLKHQGGDAGHRGIRSIIQTLQSGEFIRLRLGIGRPLSREEIVDYVLTPFTVEETERADEMIDAAVAKLEHLVVMPTRPCSKASPSGKS